MQINPDKRSVERAGSFDRTIDQGLRSYMLRVYNYMFAGLCITGVVSYVASTNEQVMTFLHSGFVWILFIGMLGMAFALPARINKMKASTAQLLFLLFTFLEGLVLSYIFLLYTSTSIVRVFFITATMFGVTSLYGYTTKKDLTSMGSIMFMGLIGIIIASVVNIFMHSTMMAFIVSVAGVVIFTGLTAWDTQRIKEIYYAGDADDVMDKKAILGAFSLFLDFINLFIMLLRLLGDRR